MSLNEIANKKEIVIQVMSQNDIMEKEKLSLNVSGDSRKRKSRSDSPCHVQNSVAHRISERRKAAQRLSETNEMEVEDNGDEISSGEVPPSRITGNTLYRLQLEEEDRRRALSRKSGLLDEDEDENLDFQRGLGEFGYRNMKAMDEEKKTLRLDKGDLDYIVDDVSDGEDDDEEKECQRLTKEIREDIERTLAAEFRESRSSVLADGGTRELVELEW